MRLICQVQENQGALLESVGHFLAQRIHFGRQIRPALRVRLTVKPLGRSQHSDTLGEHFGDGSLEGRVIDHFLGQIDGGLGDHPDVIRPAIGLQSLGHGPVGRDEQDPAQLRNVAPAQPGEVFAPLSHLDRDRFGCEEQGVQFQLSLFGHIGFDLALRSGLDGPVEDLGFESGGAPVVGPILFGNGQVLAGFLHPLFAALGVQLLPVLVAQKVRAWNHAIAQGLVEFEAGQVVPGTGVVGIEFDRLAESSFDGLPSDHVQQQFEPQRLLDDLLAQFAVGCGGQFGRSAQGDDRLVPGGRTALWVIRDHPE